MNLADPDQWPPYVTSGYHRSSTRPEVGALIAWRYGIWSVTEVRPVEDFDLTDEDRERLAIWKPHARAQNYPYKIVLTHVCGPVLAEHVKRLHDGSKTVHLGVRANSTHRWVTPPDRYPVCSCHGDPWPCQAEMIERQSAAEAKQMERQLASTLPDTCANCLEPITPRQKSITFPGPSLIVPGAPGPRFHTRQSCSYAADKYAQKLHAADPSTITPTLFGGPTEGEQ